MPPGQSRSGQTSSKYFEIRAKSFLKKNKNLAGESGIVVLVAKSSQIGALKKHAPLIFSWDAGLTLKVSPELNQNDMGCFSSLKNQHLLHFQVLFTEQYWLGMYWVWRGDEKK